MTPLAVDLASYEGKEPATVIVLPDPDDPSTLTYAWSARLRHGRRSSLAFLRDHAALSRGRDPGVLGCGCTGACAQLRTEFTPGSVVRVPWTAIRKV